MGKKKKNNYKMKLTAREAQCTTLRKLYDNSTTKFWKRLMCTFVDGGQCYTYGKFRETTNLISTKMSRYGISSGDKVAILSQNMPNWGVAFFAATAFGRVAIPILPDSSENEVTNILNHSESKVIFISKRMSRAEPGFPCLYHLHLRDDRKCQGRNAQPPQPCP